MEIVIVCIMLLLFIRKILILSNKIDAKKDCEQ